MILDLSRHPGSAEEPAASGPGTTSPDCGAAGGAGPKAGRGRRQGPLRGAAGRDPTQTQAAPRLADA